MAWFRHRILESTLLLKPTTHGLLDPYDPINRVVQKEAILNPMVYFIIKIEWCF